MTNPPLRIVFAGTPGFAAAHFNAVLSNGFEVVSAYSQPDRPSGRGKKLLPTPVKAVADAYGIPVNQPLTLSEPEAVAILKAYAPDVMVVVAYGLILPQEVLNLPRYGCINVHASLLPRWRGAAPIERALMNGDRESGVSVMQMDAGLDTGPVLMEVRTSIGEDENAASLTSRLLQLGCAALVEVLQKLQIGPLQAVPQDPEHVTYAQKLQKADSQIDWTRTAGSIHNQIRALYPRSPAWCMHEGRRLRLIRTRVLREPTTLNPGTLLAVSHESIKVACGQQVLEVFEVQTEGKPAMPIGSLLNGHAGYFQQGLLL